ncbi:phage Gp37/Gp68 family protein [Variovorax sp. NFACC27]|uniref:phage Gp37/Gp68 family protein n=1 Tax=unclassified Variovorax TaxID=663243 RepID=UPI00089A174B|nr:protein gp37 [Variovorax sp. NFACC28]SEG77817.1 protein gp37 [Variovorax sp. NFACC29]SFC96770.1 protein gp37 [Variovorax sp. NFACC26]SFG09716.1 protein gp37 [Variovorax sp. NFACC27]
MSENTKIEWATHTFNPWEGCQKVGPGCDNCYAETRNARFAGGQAINWGPGAPRRRTSATTWNLPLRWNAQHSSFFMQHGHRQRVFCASLADWLDNAVDIEWLVDLLGLIRRTPDLDWLLLSKRIGNWRGRLEAAAEWLREGLATASEESVALLRWIERWLAGDAPTNVWLGSTIVNPVEADRDVPKLLATPARVRFLSMEPLLGMVNLTVIDVGGHGEIYPLHGTTGCEDDDGNPMPDLPRIDWVIVGGESGPGARPMNPDWARSLRHQCNAAGVPFLFKQWGEWGEESSIEQTGRAQHGWWEADRADGGVPRHEWPGPIQRGVELASLRPEVFRVGKKAAGRLLDGREWNEVPHGAA